MSDILPEEVCYDILLHVPAISLFRFRSVCKTWCRIIDDIAFVTTHLDKQEGGDHLIRINYTGMLYLLPLSSIDTLKDNATIIELTHEMKVRCRPTRQYLPIPSNSGFILIDTKVGESKPWRLWNPFTQESFLLPRHDHLMTGEPLYRNCCGFGYDSAADDFKAVQIVQYWGPDNNIMTETLIFSLKSKHWKIIPNFHDCEKLVHSFLYDGVFAHRALHWMATITPKGQQSSQRIISFDLSSEKDRVLPGPSFLSLDKFYSLSLGELGGCLALRGSRALWIMQDYEKNVWTKLVSFEQLPRIGRLIAYIKRSGQVVFNNKNKGLWLVDLEKKCAKRLRLGGVETGRFTCQVFPTSLFRLNKR